MQLVIPHDIATTIATDLIAYMSEHDFGIDLRIGTVPTDAALGIDGALPYAVIECTSTKRESVSIDTYGISIDIYAQSWAESNRIARVLVAVCESLSGRTDTTSGVMYNLIALAGGPTELVDPLEPSLALVRVNLLVSTHAIVKTIN